MKQVLFLCALIIIVNSSFTQPIKANWEFKQTNQHQWHKATVPGTVHTDLLHNQLIPDPFYRDNESKLQWISKADWEYRTNFSIPANTFNKKFIELSFEGLDTYAEVYLNNHLILSANNMFRTWFVNIRPYIHSGKNNLHIVFRSAEKIADSLAQNAAVQLPCENNRNYIRKAQYHFGWDFAPKLTTCGIWRPINVIATNNFAETGSGYIRKKQQDWQVELIQKQDSIGQSFYFTINNKPTFIKGANWVPADVFLPRVTKEKYRKLLMAAKEAGIQMLRVWGGGVYEDDTFYDLCDSLKIMVWQDFMFAGAMYPGDHQFLENVKQEAVDNIKRLSKHPCVVVWCGNNEIDEAWHNWGWQKQYNFSPADSALIWNNYLQLFHDLLPKLVKEHSNKPYITTSPLYGWGRKESMTHGDSHYWGVWWGLEPLENYQKKVPRFMSEYGMQSLPSLKTIENFALPSDWDTASAVMKLHQKHPTGYHNLSTYLQQNNLYPKNFKEYISATQALQAKAIEIALSSHIGAQPRCMGSMLWQWNDCWPGVSWSIIDYYGRKKKAFYTVKKIK